MENELRIGNWVKHDPSIWSSRNYVDGVISNYGKFNEDCFQWESSDWYALGECTLTFDSLSPIELTEEWLLGLGFKKYDLDRFRIQVYGEELPAYIATRIGSGYAELNRNGHCFKTCNCEYVHELQNLYFALTGLELKLKN